MRLLAIDTTAQFGSIALAGGGGVIAEQLLHGPEGFGHLLFEAVNSLLRTHGWRLAEIDAFAGAAGPGSFTGVRVGLTAIKGFAEAAGKSAYAVSNLQALAALGTAPLRATFIDARRGEVYAALYDAELRPVVQEQVLPFPRWLEMLPETGFEFVSTGFAPFRPSLAGSRWQEIPFREARALAGAVARVAVLRGVPVNAAALDANYVRRSDAELLWKDANLKIP